MRDGWVETPIGDVAQVLSGFAFKSELFNKSEGIPLVRIRDLPKRDSTEALYSGSYEDRYVVKKGDFLIGMDGEFHCYEWNGPDALLNQRVCRIQDFKIGRVVPRYIYFAVNQYLDKIEQDTGYTTVKHISAKQVLGITIPLPPLPEQKRIVDLISSVDSYIEALQQQQNFAKQLLQALCQETFLAEGDFVQLHTVATCIMGQSPEGSTCNKNGIGTPLLTGPTEFQRNNWVGPPRQWTTNETKISISQDILFCVRGATAGRMNLTNYRSVIGRGLAAIRCEDPMDTHFVRFALQFGSNQLLPSAGGTIFPNISQSQLRGFNLPWPHETERRSLASLLKSVEDNSETLDHNLAATKNLRSSLLHDLLSGKHEIPTTYDKVIGAA